MPKTLVRHLVRYYADTCGDEETKAQFLLDVLDTPVSPELLPPEDGVISQKTEDLVGPYELHDFFLILPDAFWLYAFRRSFTVMARYAFSGVYDERDDQKMAEVPFIVVSLHSSSSVPACRMVRRSEA